MLNDLVTNGASIGFPDWHAAAIPHSYVPAFVHFFGAAFAARAPLAVGQSTMKTGLRSFTNDWLRIELHVDGGQGRLDEERDEEQENEKAENGY